MANDVDAFIPEIWSQELAVNYDAASVVLAAGFFNREYEGDISASGDTVHVQQLGSITVGPYSNATGIVIQDLDDDDDTLVIDKNDYFAFVVTSVEEAQTNIDLKGSYSKRATIAMALRVDTVLLAEADSCEDDNIIGTDDVPISITNANAVDQILELGLRLDDQNVPRLPLGIRKLAIPPWYAKHIKDSELGASSYSGDSESMKRTGVIGGIDQFDIFLTANLKETGSPAATINVLGCIPDFLTFANQLTEMRANARTSNIDIQIDGNMLYGYKVFDFTALAGACLKCIRGPKV